MAEVFDRDHSWEEADHYDHNSSREADDQLEVGHVMDTWVLVEDQPLAEEVLVVPMQDGEAVVLLHTAVPKAFRTHVASVVVVVRRRVAEDSCRRAVGEALVYTVARLRRFADRREGRQLLHACSGHDLLDEETLERPFLCGDSGKYRERNSNTAGTIISLCYSFSEPEVPLALRLTSQKERS